MITPNAVVFGDCLEVMKDVASESVDMILCDLPYGLSRNKWDVVIDPTVLWAQYERIIKPNGAILLFGQDKFTARMMLSNEKLHRYNIIWDKVLKSGFLNAKKMPLREHEDIMVFYANPPVYNPQMELGEKNHSKGSAVGKQAADIHSNRSYGNYKLVETSDSNLKYPASIWRFPKPHPSVALHGTEKPVELLRYAIRTYTKEGDVVLDNCCGTGSTLLAAKIENRRYIGIDNGVCDKKSSQYYGLPWVEVAEARLEAINEQHCTESA
jgi:DNA modification methylase